MAKPYSISVLKGVGHPWHTDDPFWDMMIIKATDDAVLGQLEEASIKKGWKLLSTGYADRMGKDHYEPLAVATFYKPQRKSQDQHWADRPWPDPQDW